MLELWLSTYLPRARRIAARPLEAAVA
jgi:hypothetical protein